MVEQWSPKPRAEGSSPSAPAKSVLTALAVGADFVSVIGLEAEALNVPGNSAEPRQVGETARRSWRSGRKRRGKSRKGDRSLFRAPQEGLRSNFKSFCHIHYSLNFSVDNMYNTSVG